MVESFEAWLDALRKKRERWVAASHENDFDRGIWNATVEKYADPTHFIFGSSRMPKMRTRPGRASNSRRTR